MDVERIERGSSLSRAQLLAWYWVPVIAYAVLIFFVSSLSHPEETLPGFLEGLSDKFLHMLEYGLLGILFYRAFRYAAGPSLARYALVLAVLAATVYGCTDEIHQAFVPEREMEWWDLFADGAGATVGAWIWQKMPRTLFDHLLI